MNFRGKEILYCLKYFLDIIYSYNTIFYRGMIEMPKALGKEYTNVNLTPTYLNTPWHLFTREYTNIQSLIMPMYTFNFYYISIPSCLSFPCTIYIAYLNVYQFIFPLSNQYII